MIGDFLKRTLGLGRPATDGQDLAAQLERLEHERVKVASLKAQLEQETRRGEEAAARLAALQAEQDTLALSYQQLRKQLRWHWAAHPETKGEWLGPDRSRDLFADRAQVLKTRLVDLMAAPGFVTGDRRVTAVVTSCGRYDLLAETLGSFFARNTHPQTRMIVVEDGDQDPDDSVKARFQDRPIEWINTGGRGGQIRAIDLAYSRVETPYIFHMEDDWIYVRPGFIEKSLAILEAEPLCLQVWIKGKPGPRGHGADPIDRRTGEVAWRPVIRDRKNFWHGFSFNPGLRRLRDYRLLGRFSDVAEAMQGKAGIAEAQISEIYGSVGYFAAQLWEDDGAAFVDHIGGDRHVA
jgi:hypothetical protein